jgi:Mrp family chromosome partitioning ATPase
MSKNFELLQQVDKLFGVAEAVPAAPPVVAVEAPPASTPALHVGGTARDEITKLVQRLFLAPATEAPRTVLLSATERGNGSSWLCARIGELLASQVNKTVCLVDCNFRNPSLHKEFGLENHYGLTEALMQNEGIRQYLQPLARPNLCLLTNGSPAEDGLALLGSDRMRSRLQELRNEFDYVIMDAAALDAGNDGIVLGGLSDGTVLVLRANISRRDSARKALHELQAAGVVVRGVVLNRRMFPIPESIYRRL